MTNRWWQPTVVTLNLIHGLKPNVFEQCKWHSFRNCSFFQTMRIQKQYFTGAAMSDQISPQLVQRQRILKEMRNKNNVSKSNDLNDSRNHVSQDQYESNNKRMIESKRMKKPDQISSNRESNTVPHSFSADNQPSNESLAKTQQKLVFVSNIDTSIVDTPDKLISLFNHYSVDDNNDNNSNAIAFCKLSLETKHALIQYNTKSAAMHAIQRMHGFQINENDNSNDNSHHAHPTPAPTTTAALAVVPYVSYAQRLETFTCIYVTHCNHGSSSNSSSSPSLIHTSRTKSKSKSKSVPESVDNHDQHENTNELNISSKYLTEEKLIQLLENETDGDIAHISFRINEQTKASTNTNTDIIKTANKSIGNTLNHYSKDKNATTTKKNAVKKQQKTMAKKTCLWSAFVTFAEHSSALKALDVGHKYGLLIERYKNVNERKKYIRKLQSGDRHLYVKGLSSKPSEMSEEKLFRMFRPFGKLTLVNLVTDRNPVNMNNSIIGYVSFENASEANTAKEVMRNQGLFVGISGGTKLKVSEAKKTGMRDNRQTVQRIH